MLARLDPRRLARVSFPLGTQTKAETRAEAAAAGLAAAGRAESQEACFLAGGDYRAFLGAARARGRARSARRRDRRRGRQRTTATGGSRPGSAAASASPRREPLYALETNARTNTVVVGPRAALARRAVNVRGRLFAPAGRVEAKLRYRSPAVAASVEETASGFRLRLDEPAYGVARGPGGGAVRRRRGGRFRVGHFGDGRLGLPRGDRFLLRRSRRSRARSVPRRGRCRPRLGVSAAGRNVRPAFFVDSGCGT